MGTSFVAEVDGTKKKSIWKKQSPGGVLQKNFLKYFSPVTSANIGFGPQNFLTFSFKPFATRVQNFKFVPSASLELLNLNQDHPSKK